MTDHTEAALDLLESAADSAGADVRENLRNVEEGLTAVVGDGGAAEAAGGQRLDELAEKLAGLERRTDGETREQVRAARIHVEALREEA